MAGRWDHLPEGTLTPAQPTQLVQDLTIGYGLCPPGSMPKPPDRYSIGWSIAGLGIRPSQTLVDVIHARVRAALAPHNEP